MLRRTSLICIEVAVGVVVVTGALLIVSAWRLSQGPVSLQFLMPYAREFLQDEKSPVQASVKDIVLTWAGWQRALDVRAEDVSIRTASGQRLARIREVSVSLSFRALLQGVVAPTSLEIIRPRLLLVRQKDGEIQVDIADNATGTGAAGVPPAAAADDDVDRRVNMLPLLIDGLSGIPKPGSRLRFLDRIRVIGGALRVLDEQLGVTWGASYADVTLRRARHGLTVDYDLDLELPGTPGLHGQIVYRKAEKRVDTDVAFSNVDIRALAGLSPSLADLTALSAKAGGTVSLDFGLDGGIRQAEFLVHTGAGSYLPPGAGAKPLDFRSVQIAGRVDRNPDQLQITDARIDLGKSGIDTTAVVTRVGEEAAVSATAKVNSIPVDEVEKYWPAAVGAGARGWVIPNIHGGHVHDAVVNLTARVGLEGQKKGEVSVDSVNGRFAVSGATINYFDPLPVLTEGKATATFSTRRFDFAVQSGRVGKLLVSDGAISIWDIGEPREMLSVSTRITGPVADALAVIENPRLKLVSRMGLDPTGAAGTQSTRLKVTLPLFHDITDDDLTVSATTHVSGLVLAHVLKNEGISDGEADLSINNNGLRAEGDATYAGTPLRFVWKEDFTGKTSVRRDVSARLAVGPALRSRFGIAVPDILEGPVPTQLSVRDLRSGERVVDAQLDLAPAKLTIPGFGWTKPAGEAGKATISAVFRNDRVERITGFSVDSADTLSASGSVAFAPDGDSLRDLKIDRFRLGATDFSGDVRRGDDGALLIGLKGKGLDARPFLARLAEDGKGPDLPAFDLRADFAQVWINDGPPAAETKLTLVHSSDAWRHVEVTTALPGTNKPSSFKMEPVGAGEKLTLYSADAGTFVQALKISDAIRGGDIEASATRPGGPETTWKGVAEMKRFRVAGAPTLAKVLTLASLTGISDVVNGKDGIAFDRMTMPFAFGDSVATITDMRAVGSELGITASGKIDLAKDAIEIRGTIVPAYTINSLIGKIPVIGELLTGAKGGGLFAASYEVTGPVDNPKTNVNPLSTLAPGFLRKLIDGGSAADTSPTSTPASPGD